MPPRRISLLLSSLLWLLSFACTTLAHAEGLDAPDAMQHRALYWHADGGMGLPVGVTGGGLGFAPTPWSALELGVGLSRGGPQAAASLGFHTAITPRTRLGVASGPSFGPLLDRPVVHLNNDDEDFEKRWDWVLWWNAGVMVRRSLGPRSSLRLHAGLATPLTHGELRCDSAFAELCDGRTLGVIPFLGLGYQRDF